MKDNYSISYLMAMELYIRQEGLSTVGLFNMESIVAMGL
jgi:hypothetical protein